MPFTFSVKWHTPIHNKLFQVLFSHAPHAPPSTYHPESLLQEHHHWQDLAPVSPASLRFVLTNHNVGSQVHIVTRQLHLLQVHLLGSEERTPHRQTLPFTPMSCRASSHSQIVMCDSLPINGETGYHIALLISQMLVFRSMPYARSATTVPVSSKILPIRNRIGGKG